jgi:hypothetical protein
LHITLIPIQKKSDKKIGTSIPFAEQKSPKGKTQRGAKVPEGKKHILIVPIQKKHYSAV